MHDETDKEILHELRPAYERMKQSALARYDDAQIVETDHVRVNGRYLTLMLYLKPAIQTGYIEEQFEYYDYRYYHKRLIAIPDNVPDQQRGEKTK